jgi:hypothetical protein
MYFVICMVMYDNIIYRCKIIKVQQVKQQSVYCWFCCVHNKKLGICKI